MAAQLSGRVSASKLADAIQSGAKKLAILDASWYMPAANRNPFEEYKARRIRGAKFFDLDGKFSDLSSPYPHMLPSKAVFYENVAALGIEKGDTIVAYDGSGVFSAARCWWMFKVMGWEIAKLGVLDGGLVKFASDYPELIDYTCLSNEQALQWPQSTLDPSEYELQQQYIRETPDIEANLKSRKEVVVDARPTGRFNGTTPEPRPGLPSGHMPHSVSIPFTDLLNSGTLKTTEEIQSVFSKQGIDITHTGTNIINSCGSGVSAAVVDFALHVAGSSRESSVYDGSWTEYADPKFNRPIVKE